MELGEQDTERACETCEISACGHVGSLSLSLSLSLIADDVDISFVRFQSLPLYKAP